MHFLWVSFQTYPIQHIGPFGLKKKTHRKWIKYFSSVIFMVIFIIFASCFVLKYNIESKKRFWSIKYNNIDLPLTHLWIGINNTQKHKIYVDDYQHICNEMNVEYCFNRFRLPRWFWSSIIFQFDFRWKLCTSINILI